MTAVLRTTNHLVQDHGAGETYQVQVHHLADGSYAAYRDDEHQLPVEDGVLQALLGV